jgi:hypothetical protein
MLPMLFAPGAQGDLGERQFSPRPPLPVLADVWPDATRASAEFWTQVGADNRVSSNFRSISERALGVVTRHMGRFG